jgi:hypothetical protein
MSDKLVNDVNLPDPVEYNIALADKVDRLTAELERLRGAISWIEPPFVDEKTPEEELRRRVSYCVADAKRAALTQEPRT